MRANGGRAGRPNVSPHRSCGLQHSFQAHTGYTNSIRCTSQVHTKLAIGQSLLQCTWRQRKKKEG
jgi:hypothetical protein